MPVSNSSYSQKPYVSLKKKYEALKESDPSFIRQISNRSMQNGTMRITPKSYTKPTQYLSEIKDYQNSWKENFYRSFGHIITNTAMGEGFLIRNSHRTSEDFENILNNTASQLHRTFCFYHDDKIWEERLPIEKIVIDIFGNFIQDNSYHYQFKKNDIDHLAYPTLHKNVKPDFEIDPSAKKYRELIAKQLINPEHKVHALSTEHYGVYEAHDHTKKHPHLLIIPHHKKYRDFPDLVKNGKREEIKDYLKVLEKVANEGPRLPKLEHELFFTDAGDLQKVPFFYTEYIPRRNEGLPEQQNPHVLLKDISMGEIKQGDVTPFKEIDKQNLDKWLEYSSKLKAEAKAEGRI